jgi:amino acid transporter/nucleotide-binding universal stress UspA family protein
VLGVRWHKSNQREKQKWNNQMARNRSNSRVEVSLSRDLRLFDITMIGVGAMIGAGIFVLTGIAAGEAGPALVLAFLLNGVVTSLTAMAYAELGSAFPEAGGGFLWVKEALGGASGFLAGWMSWFAHAVAGSLYALAFGRFATELYMMAGLPAFGLSVHWLSLIFTTLIAAFFTMVNYMGASETGTIGNVITVTKIVILAMFVVFGVIAMANTDSWHQRYTTGFLPNGFSGVVVAMGLTFIAFEGYEIIAQSGEEVINPKRTIPRAIFLAIAIAVIIYILVAFTTIGAIQVPPELVHLAPHEYLGERREIAIVDAAQQFFPFGIGAVVLLISGLASTMSALNATTYSSSRVSFAMGREGNLPAIFSHIHSERHTPHWAVILSGVLIAIMAWLLPIEDVAAAADIMFLLLFVQVNISVMILRHKRPDLERGFLIPWFPAVPLLGLLTQAGLAIYLFTFSQTAWYFAAGWLVVGLLAYYIHFSRTEAMEKPIEILLEEVLVSRDYSVLVPVSSLEQARVMGRIGAILAEDNGGEVLALYVPHVPPQLTLADGRLFLRDGRPFLEAVIEQAREQDVPVHTMIRLGRNEAEAISKTAIENASDVLVLAWPEETGPAGHLFGGMVGQILSNPPTDVALVRYREYRPLRSILVPISSGPNSRHAVKVAISMARREPGEAVRVHLAHVVPVNPTESQCVRARQAMAYVQEGNPYEHIETELIEGHNVTDTILAAAQRHDLIVMGATKEPLFHTLLLGTIPQQIAQRAATTVIMVKRQSGLLRSVLKQTVVPPAANPES